MAWSSYAENINDIRCDLEHLAGCWSKPAEVDVVAAKVVLAAAQRVLREIEATLEIVTDPNLEVAGEIVRLRAREAEQEKGRRGDLERIDRLSREAAARALETMYWRDAYFEFSRRSVKSRRRPFACRK
jgi:hypothetical protein